MNFKRIGMTLVSLVLVVCLMFNVSPIRANAFIDPIFVGWSLTDALFAIGVGIGIGFGVEVVEEMHESAEQWKVWINQNLDEGEVAELYNSEGLVNILATNDPDMPYMISEKMVNSVRDWVFSSGIVVEDVASAGMAYFNNWYLPVLSDSLTYMAITYEPNSERFMAYMSSSIQPYIIISEDYVYGGNDYSIYFPSGGRYSYYVCNGDFTSWIRGGSGNTGVGFAADTLCWTNFNIYDKDGNFYMAASEISNTVIVPADENNTLYDIAPSTSSLADGYPLWHQNSYVHDNGDGTSIRYYPISVGDTFEDTIKATQEDVWAGISSGSIVLNPDPGDTPIVPPDIGLEDVTLSDISTILSSIAQYQQTGNIQTQTKLDGLTESFGITNGLLDENNSLLSSLIASNALGFETVTNSIISLPGAIGDELTDIENQIGTLGGLIGGIGIDTDTMKDTLAGILAGVTAIPAELAEAIAAVLSSVFIPTEGYVDAKVDVLTAKFPVVNSIQSTGEDLKDFFVNLGQKPPIIYIDLGAQRGFHNIGGRTAFIDLTWYAEYKPTMDAILSAFLWLWFAWRMFLSAPGILQGASGAWRTIESHAGKDASSFKGDSGGKSEWNIPFGYTYQDIKEWHEDTIAEYEHTYGRRR